MTGEAIIVREITKKYSLTQSTESYRYKTLQEEILSLPSRIFQRKKNVQDFYALRDVNFTVMHGERVGIIGGNGAGKSTLLKLIGRVTAPTAGKIEIRGRVASLLEVGTGFHPELTGRENIFLNGSLMGMTKVEIINKFDEIVDFAEIEKFLDVPVKRYSSGMYVKLAFSIAAHLEPEILLVDEVLAVGDVRFQKKCLGKMQDITKDAGRTILFVSHSIATIQNLCNRCILLEHGKLVAEGDTKFVIDKYLSLEGPLDNLLNTSSRKGTGALQIVGFSLRGADGLKLRYAQVGTPVTIEFEVINHLTNPINNSHISLGINNSLGIRVGYLDSDISGTPLREIPAGASKIRIHLDCVTLVQGSYSITTFIKINGDISDWVKDLVRFDVEDGDFFGSGKSFTATDGMFFIQHKYSN